MALVLGSLDQTLCFCLCLKYGKDNPPATGGKTIDHARTAALDRSLRTAILVCHALFRLTTLVTISAIIYALLAILGPSIRLFRARDMFHDDMTVFEPLALPRQPHHSGKL